jgi:simple sugar transport system permease protein
LITSRAGYLNIAVEGVMLASAFAAIAGTKATGSAWAGMGAAVLAGIAANLINVFLAKTARMGYVLSGITVLLAAGGVTELLARIWFPNGTSLAGNTLRGTGPLNVSPFFVLTVGAVVAIGCFFRFSRLGLTVRAAGEGAEVARAFGASVERIRLAATVVGGICIGFSGAALSLGVVGDFTEDMTGGRGFIALACVILGAWNPFGIVIAAMFFGLADATQFSLASRQAGYIGQVIVVLPYIATLAAVGAFWGRAQGPVEESRDLEPRSD